MLEALVAAGFRPSLFDAGEWRPVTVAQLARLDRQRDTAWTRSDDSA